MNMASTHIRVAIEMLLDVYELTNMIRGTDDESAKSEWRQSALKSFPTINEQLALAARDLETK